MIKFLVATLLLLTIWAAFSFRKMSLAEIKAYFSDRTGLGILKGVALALAVILLSFLASWAFADDKEGSYLNYVSIYAGLDYTKNESPLCEPVGVDSHTTSNMGFRANLYESYGKQFSVNSKYTHHSCAFSPDENSYDAVGVEIEYRLWNK